MTAYLIARISVSDADRWNQYRAAVTPLVERFGGRYVVRGGVAETVEGAPEDRRLVVIAFESMARAKEFWNSPEYAEARALREGAARLDVVLVEGA